MSYQFRHSICNEIFEGWTFAATCQAAHRIGYRGLEIAPFRLSERPDEVAAGQRREYSRILSQEGLRFAGLHWLMASPKGLHVTTADEAVRARSWQHIDQLIDLCADLAGDQLEKGVMVFGSPKQRSTTAGMSREEATRRFIDGLVSVAGHAQARAVTILVEALPKNQSDVVNRLEEAAAIVAEIGSPAIRTMFDTHNTLDESEPHDVLLQRYLPVIRHVHVNEMNGHYPGSGDYDFKPVLQVLRREGYAGWVSLEVFDFSAGPERIAGDSLRYLTGLIEGLE